MREYQNGTQKAAPQKFAGRLFVGFYLRGVKFIRAADGCCVLLLNVDGKIC